MGDIAQHYPMTSSEHNVQIIRETFVKAPIDEVFDFVAAENVLPKVLTGYGLVPAVTSTSDVSGPWNRLGSKRIVHLADGSTAHEEVTQYRRPFYFSYRVSNPSFALRHLMRDATGQWWFSSAPGGTSVKWMYTFNSRGPITRIPLAVFARTQWKGYMDVCLENINNYLDR